jgi:hypothetical protein
MFFFFLNKNILLDSKLQEIACENAHLLQVFHFAYRAFSILREPFATS